MTNDGSNWFFSSVDQDKTTGRIWRIPKSVPLADNVSGYPGVKNVRYENVPALSALGYWHWGDLDHARFEGEDYLLVPITGSTAMVACFRADDLSDVNFGWLDGNATAGWCAVGVDSCLYSSLDDPSALAQYKVDWSRLVHTSDHDSIFQFLQPISLTFLPGFDPWLSDMQGGEGVFAKRRDALPGFGPGLLLLEWSTVVSTRWYPRYRNA